MLVYGRKELAEQPQSPGGHGFTYDRTPNRGHSRSHITSAIRLEIGMQNIKTINPGPLRRPPDAAPSNESCRPASQVQLANLGPRCGRNHFDMMYSPFFPTAPVNRFFCVEPPYRGTEKRRNLES